MSVRRTSFQSLLLNATAIAVVFSMLVPVSVRADISEEIRAKQRQIEELQRQIDEYEAQAQTVGQKSRTLENEIARLNAQIGQITAQIRQLETSIDQTGLEITKTTSDIADAERMMDLHLGALAQYIRASNEMDQKSLAQVILQNNALSDFFDYVHQVQRTQDSLRITIRSIRELHAQLDDRRDELEGKKGELERLKTLTEIQQRDLASTKGAKNTVLKETKGQEAKFQQLIKRTKQDLDRLREQINYLVSSGISVEDAVSFAQLAAIGAGIRPAFLLALLETESRMGRNVGTGNWQDDMYLCYLRLANIAKTAERKQYYQKRAETEKNAFLAVIGKLGLDPNSVKVSKEPSYGCGGAMGPAQFIPSTWLGYESEVIRITGHATPNPWNFQDAFTASAVKLARGGATSKDRAGEVRAAKAYISGNPNCTSATCTNYANTILKKAADIERDL